MNSRDFAHNVLLTNNSLATVASRLSVAINNSKSVLRTYTKYYNRSQRNRDALASSYYALMLADDDTLYITERSSRDEYVTSTYTLHTTARF